MFKSDIIKPLVVLLIVFLIVGGALETMGRRSNVSMNPYAGIWMRGGKLRVSVMPIILHKTHPFMQFRNHRRIKLPNAKRAHTQVYNIFWLYFEEYE
jgi:hypothetical protein